MVKTMAKLRMAHASTQAAWANKADWWKITYSQYSSTGDLDVFDLTLTVCRPSNPSVEESVFVSPSWQSAVFHALSEIEKKLEKLESNQFCNGLLKMIYFGGAPFF